MNYYIIEGDNCSALDKLYIVKASGKDEALDVVMTQYIDETNKYHEEANQDFYYIEKETGYILFPIYTKDDLIVYTIDEYIQKYGKESVIEIYVDWGDKNEIWHLRSI